MTINEKVAYLKGLADGLELDKEPTKEGKLLKVIIEVLEEIGFALEELEETDQLLSEGLDAVSEDLEDVEELLLSEDDEEDECDCGCGCGHDHEHDHFFEIKCPQCGTELVVDEDVLEEGAIYCPTCDETYSLDLVDDDEDDEDEDQEN